MLDYLNGEDDAYCTKIKSVIGLSGFTLTLKLLVVMLRRQDIR